MSRQLETAFIDQLVGFDFQHGQVLVDKIAHIEILAIGAEHSPSGKAPTGHLGDEVDLLALDLQHADRPGR